METIESFEKKLIEALVNSNYVKHVAMDSILGEFESSSLLKVISEPLRIEIDEEGLVFTDDSGDKIRCPNFSTNISDDGRWLSDKLPSVPFDVEQAGNIRKAEEAESAYCCACVVLVLKDQIFKDEMVRVINNYDYQEMDGVTKGINFRKLLTDWQDLQSTIINVAVSAAKYNISSVKKDTEKFLRDGIPEGLVIELRNLDTKVKDINRKFSTGILSPTNVRKLTKIEILTELERKNTEINNIVTTSGVAMLYKIMHLSSEYISPITKKRLRDLAQTEIDKLYSSDSSYRNIVGEKRQIIERWKRRYIRLEKNSIRRREVIKYLELGDQYKLPAKL